jgi:protease YdgD
MYAFNRAGARFFTAAPRWTGLAVRVVRAVAARPAWVGKTDSTRRGRRSQAKLAVGALIALLPSGPACGPVFGQDSAEPNHRQTVDMAAPPWSALGKLYNSTGASCTAAAIADNQVLTAGHCLFNPRSQRLLAAASLHFLLGVKRGDYQVHALVQSYQLSRRYDPSRPIETLSADWAVLTLQTPLPAGSAVLPLAEPAQVEPGTAVMTGGYGQDRRFMLTADTECHVLKPVAGGQLLAHDCRAIKGYSGAPLLRRRGPTQTEVIAVNVATLSLRGEVTMIAVPVATIRRELEGSTRSGAGDVNTKP